MAHPQDPGNQVLAVFDDADSARRAVTELEDAGFDDTEVGVVIPQQVDQDTAARTVGTGLAGGAAAGAASGTILAGLVALTVPAAGPLLAGGFLGAAIAGGTIGSVTGGMIGSILGMRSATTTPEEYEEWLRRGRSFVAVRSREDRERARDIIERNGGTIKAA